MCMKKGQKQYGRVFTDNVMQIHYQEGKTIRKTVEILGVEQVVIKRAINRENLSTSAPLTNLASEFFC